LTEQEPRQERIALVAAPIKCKLGDTAKDTQALARLVGRSWRGELARSISSPARRTVHAVLQHTAHRRPSPAVFDQCPPGPVGPGCGDDSIEGDQPERVTRSVNLGEAPGAMTLMTFRQEQREPHHRVVAGLVERLGGVSVSEVPAQPRRNRFNSCTTCSTGAANRSCSHALPGVGVVPHP
jgi:hypothetical protein